MGILENPITSTELSSSLGLSIFSPILFVLELNRCGAYGRFRLPDTTDFHTLAHLTIAFVPARCQYMGSVRRS